MKQRHQRFKRDEICEAIREMIVTKKLNVGDKLGAERVLAEKMSVQRLTVRRAIKQLCAEGVLEQRPNSGTYVKSKIVASRKSAVDEHHDEVFAPTGNILISSPDTVIEFKTNDTHPDHVVAWNHIFTVFAEMHPGIVVKHAKQGLETSKNKYFDCQLVRSIDLHNKRFSGSCMLFPETWFSAHTPEPFLSNDLVKRINNYNEKKGGFSAVPLLLTFPVQCVNANLLEKQGVETPPSGKPWIETAKWLKSFDSNNGLLPPNPYTHSPLNHLCRVNKRIINSNRINLNFPDVIEFLEFMKRVWQKTSADSFREKDGMNLTEMFTKGKIISSEYFLHLIPNIQKQCRFDMRIAANSIAPFGMTQLLPRFLRLGDNVDKYYETVEFCQFLASNEGQDLIAELGFGIPYYNAKRGAERFCSRHNIDLDVVRTELETAGGFYESVFFKSGFQERIVNPLLIGYFNDDLTLDSAIENISSRTQQLHDLFFGNANEQQNNTNQPATIGG